LLLTGAALGDRFGRRRIFIAGLAVFTLASVACALSANIGALIAARALQGAGAAMVLPLSLTLISAVFAPRQWGKAMGLYLGLTGLATSSGPFIGGVIAQGLAWQWIFWLNLPIGVIAILVFASLYGSLFFLAQYFQTVSGEGPIGPGLRLMPWTATLMVFAPIAGRLADQVGERRFVVGGLLLQTLGSGWIAVVADTGTAHLDILPALIIGGAGLTMAMPAAQKAAVGAVPPRGSVKRPARS